MDLTPKRAAESATEMVQVVLPNDANPLGFILGGTVMHLIDIAGAIACHRHTRSLLVTAAVDDLQFLHPIKVGDLIILKSRVTCVFHTSLEAQVDVYSEETLTGEQKLTSRAFLTFVADRAGWRARGGAAAARGDRRGTSRVRGGAGAPGGAPARRKQPRLRSDAQRRRCRQLMSVSDAFLSLSTLFSRSMPTRYLLRNCAPTIPPSWNPSSALGASRLSTTTGKFLYLIASNDRSTPGSRNASCSHPEVPYTFSGIRRDSLLPEGRGGRLADRDDFAAGVDDEVRGVAAGRRPRGRWRDGTPAAAARSRSAPAAGACRTSACASCSR